MVVFVVALYPPNGGDSSFWPLKALKGASNLVETQWQQALAEPCLGDAFLLLAGFWVVPGIPELQPPGHEQQHRCAGRHSHPASCQRQWAQVAPHGFSSRGPCQHHQGKAWDQGQRGQGIGLQPGGPQGTAGIHQIHRDQRQP